jgi:hypothetical protein
MFLLWKCRRRISFELKQEAEYYTNITQNEYRHIVHLLKKRF